MTARLELKQQWARRAPRRLRRWHLARDYARYLDRERLSAEALLSRLQGVPEGRARFAPDSTGLSAAKVRVAIYGSWEESWMRALGPESEIWAGLRAVTEVRTFAGTTAELEQYAAAAETPLLVIPLVETHALAVPDALRARQPRREVIRLLAHKARAATYLATRWPDCLPRNYATVEAVTYPCIVKTVAGCGSVGVTVVESPTALLDVLQTHWLAGEGVVIQDFVPGEREQVTHAMCAAGKLLWHCTLEKPQCLNPHARGGDFLAETVLQSTSSGILGILQNLVAELDYSGPLCVDYRLCEGRPVIFEINPRFGGSLMAPRFRSLLRESIHVLIDSLPSLA